MASACCNNLACMKSCCQCVKQRYLLSFMCGMAVLNLYTMRLVLNIAITVMVKPVLHKGNATNVEGACPGQLHLTNNTRAVGDFDWSQKDQGFLLGSFFWLYWLSHIPGGVIAQRWGGKPLLLTTIFITAVLTLLTPVAARYGGIYTLTVVRVLEGVMEGPAFPAVNVLIAHWSPKSEKSYHSSFSFSGAILGSVLANSLSGVILHTTNNNWDLLFYVFGLIAIAWCLLFWLLCTSQPWDHPCISQAEHDYLDVEMTDIKRGKVKVPTPWKKILTSVPVIALVIEQIGHDWIFFALITDLPKYMKDVLHFRILELGMYGSIPYLFEWLVAIVCGRIADCVITRNWVRTIWVRRIFGTTSSVIPALAIIAASMAGCNLTAAMIAFTVSLGLIGTFYPGVKVNALDLSPNHAGVLMGIVNGLGAMSGVMVPVLIGYLTPNSSLLEWRVAFIVIGIVTIVCNVIYCVLGSADVQPWNEPKPPEAPAP